MLLAVGPNPTIDRTVHVPHLTVGAVHRATRVDLGAGGKGPNTTRVALALGYEALTTGPLGGHSGHLMADLTAAEPLPADWYWVEGVETRSTLLMNHDTGDATVINEPGPLITPEAWEGFAAHVTRLAARSRAVAFCGSLPPGVAPGALGGLARSLATAGRAVYVDTSGAPLAAALAQPAGLCIKVNRAELAAGLALKPNDLSSRRLAEAGYMLLARAAALVVVTLGREGALAVAPEGCWQATPPQVEVVSSVGSGDSLLAGLAVARLRGQSIEAALAFGVACGAANAMTPLPGRVDAGTVESLLARVSVARL
jgi:tagatose 6-phosphate kinase